MAATVRLEPMPHDLSMRRSQSTGETTDLPFLVDEVHGVIAFPSC